MPAAAGSPRKRPAARGGAAADCLAASRGWFTARGWEPFPFQEQVWRAFAAGSSGLLHAPTGTGKTLAAWLGALARARTVDEATGPPAGSLRVVWITPLRALAADTARATPRPPTAGGCATTGRRRW